MAETPSGDGGGSESSPVDSAQAERIGSIVAAALTGEGLSGDPDKKLSRKDSRAIRRARKSARKKLRSSEDIRRADEELDLNLKSRVAWFALIAVAVQLATADIVFVLYAWLGRDWNVPTSAIQVWLAATVVQVIGILYVITDYLFSDRHRRRKGDSEDGAGE